ncbi:MAG: putative Ig domain-containing protein [Steroidobacteraceae bacterium]|nr:putative Ig domain-containing protein [Steroidobacteraceae bacterium]
MAAQAKTLGTALAVTLLGIATTLASTAHAQSMGGGTTQPTTGKANAKPTITGNPSRMLVAGSYYDFRPSASDPDSAKLTFSINKKPAWANFDATTGRLYGTPSAIDVGKIKGIQVSVSDGEKVGKLTKFGIKVIAGQPPVISGTPATSATEGQAYQFQPSASDSDAQTLQFAVINKPSWASFDKVTGRLSGTPPAGSAGTYASIVVSVTDGATTVSLPSFAINVAPGQAVAANTPPQIGGTPPSTVQVGQTYDFVPSATDRDGDTLVFASVNVPAWLTFDRASGRLTGKPQTGQEGSYADIVISVSDGEEIVFLAPFTVTVQPSAVSKGPVPNAAPSISGTPVTSVGEGKAYAFQPTASDPEGDALSFSVANAPVWLAVSTSTGRLSGTAPAGSAGTYSGIVLSVTDGVSTVSLPAFALTVTPAPANTPPTIGGTPATKVTVGQAYSFVPLAADADGDTLTFSSAGKPAWLTFDTRTGRLSGTPSTAQLGTYSNIRISVSDGKSTASLPAFSINVAAADTTNRSPTISGNPATTATEGVAYSFQPSASDPDGDPLTFSASGVPTWLTFNSGTGRLSGTPPAGTTGSFGPIVITVSDGNSSASLGAFTITVSGQAPTNSPPTISGTPATGATVGKPYAFQPSASDADGDVLRFGVANAPSWMTFDTVTGLLAGTPGDANVGTFGNIVVSVSDGKASATLPAFSITVSAVPVENRAPTISGSPATSVTVGQAYVFQPTASDADGDVLRFGIANAPSWASFDVVTGRLSGSPASTGSYANIVISVSDGTASATLAPFTINVVAPVVGSAELNWTAPTQNEDGSALTNLAGYKIRYGTSPGALNKLVDVVGAGITTATIEGLTAGTWYFSVSSYTNTGVESAPTGTVYKTIQ